MSSSTTDDVGVVDGRGAGDGGLSMKEVESLKTHIQQLLTICAENDVTIPDELKESLLLNNHNHNKSSSSSSSGNGVVQFGEEEINHLTRNERESSRRDKNHFISSLVKRQQQDHDDDDHEQKNEKEHELIQDFRRRMEIVQGQLPYFDLRIQNGSYKVLVPDKENDIIHNKKKKKKKNGNDDNHDDDGDDDADAAAAGATAKQNIATLQNSNPLYQLYTTLIRCLYQQGKPQIQLKEKIIMKDINLILEPSKMYLVLGAPGSGKSTLLKMIAQNLSQQKGEIMGGSVSINGVTPLSKHEATKMMKKKKVTTTTTTNNNDNPKEGEEEEQQQQQRQENDEEEGGNNNNDNNEINQPVIWSNLVGYIDQIDRLHPYLTVKETCEFAWKCRSGGTHRQPWFTTGPEVDQLIQEMDDELIQVKKILQGLGLTRVQDTFVGDQATVRGVSGGEKKRVTVAEMLCVTSPIICCDEISTGLDAATTYDITLLMRQATRVRNSTLIVSLLQPPPETVSNFDNIILLSQGKIIYCGPVNEVLDYFQSLGYELPDRMDVADWLQTLPTKDGAAFLKKNTTTPPPPPTTTSKEDKGGDGEDKVDGEEEKVEEEPVLTTSKQQQQQKHLTTDEFVQKFYDSDRGKAILSKLNSPTNDKDAPFVRDLAKDRYANTQLKSLELVVRREMLLWWRDKYQLKQKIGQNLILGIVVGTLFWQADVASIIGVMFQTMFVQVLGSMLLVVKQFPYRSIFYKQQDANFFPTWTYVAGRSLANIPNSLIDSLLFGTIIYWFAGFAFGDGASFASYIMWLIILFMTSFTTGLFFGMFPSMMSVITLAQAAMAVTLVIFILFSGFAIQPDVIPDWYIWAYWINPLAWVFRGLAVNEFDSGAYDDPSPQDPNLTQGQAILILYGFTDRNDEPFDFPWAGYAVLFLIGISLIGAIVTTVNYDRIRFSTGKSLAVEIDDEEEKATAVVDSTLDVAPIPFKRCDLSFKDMHYTVISSITNEPLELLKGIDGVVEAGKMTALMGSSGAGKTTLMDVLALRKSSGVVDGDVRVNGHPQEEISFRRSTGYVEQFAKHSEQLTIRETVEFSAKLRLDSADPAVTEESTKELIDLTLDMLELTVIQNLQVGSDETGGLSFEQNKRLSIAVELVANPSIIFLDEPTSGLDARAASIVMRGLQRIARSGRAVCATIHQPSIAIFSDFDSLLLLKRGGEVVFHGELGPGSSNLIEYLEQYDTTPKIQIGENPATWMLTTIGAGSAGSSGKSFDYAGAYHDSKLRSKCLERIEEINSEASDENRLSFDSKFATDFWTQSQAVLSRAATIYFRSPNYNITRNMVSIVVAIIFGTSYIDSRNPSTESEVNSIFNSIFIAVLFLSVSAQNTVLGVFEKERNQYYLHKASNMYGSVALVRAYTIAELPFILFSAILFVLPFYFLMGFAVDAEKFFLFYCFTVLGFTTFTFTGQMFVALVRDAETAQAVGGMFVTFSVLFSGILIRPDQIPAFWEFAYWIFPGHYLFEALYATQFHDDTTVIEATPGSPFFNDLLINDPECTPDTDTCKGTIARWFAVNFSDFDRDNVFYGGIYFACFIVFTRVITLVALATLNYRST